MSLLLEKAPTLSQNAWELDSILLKDHQVPQYYHQNAPQEVAVNFERLLGRDVYSEGDARIFYDYIQSRRSEMSESFLAMLDLWLADELKHYEALRRVFHSVFGVSYVAMDAVFSRRTHNFTPIRSALEDEFTILLTLMFDEIGSVYSYRRDLQEYYRHFGRNVLAVGHHLVRDEGVHFNNAAAILLHCHRDRLGEAAAFLESIAALECDLTDYYQTFLLDHAREQYRFPSFFNPTIVRLILSHLGLGERPSARQLKDLWQWVPAGHSLVPVTL